MVSAIVDERIPPPARISSIPNMIEPKIAFSRRRYTSLMVIIPNTIIVMEREKNTPKINQKNILFIVSYTLSDLNIPADSSGVVGTT